MSLPLAGLSVTMMPSNNFRLAEQLTPFRHPLASLADADQAAYKTKNKQKKIQTKQQKLTVK